MKTEQILMATTILAKGALVRLRMVNFAGTQAVAGEPVLGVANTDYAPGEQAGVSTHGQILVEAGGAIAAGDAVESDAQGRAIKATTGDTWGKARDAAAAAGEVIRVLR